MAADPGMESFGATYPSLHHAAAAIPERQVELEI